MLVRLLREHLRPYGRALLAVVALQLVGTMASLYLPSLNADIIDNGVATRRHRLHLGTGGWMLAVTLLQIACSIAAVYFGARAAMGFGRDVRVGDLPPASASSPRARSTAFGAPSLITRNTNDVQQVQMLVLMTCTMLVAAPIMCVGGIVMALREDVGLSWLLVVSVPGAGRSRSASIIVRMVPQFRLMQARIDAVNRVLREQITGIRVVRAFVREPVETERFARGQRRRSPTIALPRRAAAGADVPDRDAGAQRLERRGAVVRRRPHRRGPDADRRAHRVPHLPDADPDGGHDGDVHGDHDPARRGVRRADQRGARHRVDGRAAAQRRSRRCAPTGSSSSTTSTFRYPGAAAPVLRDISFTALARADDGDHRQHRRGQDDAARR